MITGTGGLLLYLWVLLGFAIIGMSLVVSLLQTRFLVAIQRFRLPVRHSLLWCLVLFPYVAGLFIAALTLLPSLEHMLGLSQDHCHWHGEGHGHLCWVHAPTFIAGSWQGLSAALFALLVVLSLGKTLYRGLRHHRYSSLLTALAEFRQGTYELDSDIPSAFTLGLFQPRILVSRALKDNLSFEEMAVVRSHESSHQAKRDPLRLWLFGSLLGVFIPSVGKQFYKLMELTLEQIADARVAAETKDPLFVAQTLIKVNRLTARFLTAQPSFGACHFGGAPLEQRIQMLLNRSHQAGFPLFHFVFATAVVVALSLGSADAMHHFIEDLLHSPTNLLSH